VRELTQKSQKDYEKMHNDHSSQNDKYTTFMKEKLIYQHERDHMVQEIKKIETSVSNWEHRMTEDINSHKIHFNN
jgi:predicted  nucleic acid-binding Zn-ribbon protein